MECEVCGKLSHSPQQVELDGVIVWVCEECARLGKPIAKPVQSFSSKKPPLLPAPLDEGLDLVVDLGKRVRDARQKRGMTLEALSKLLYAKESLLHKIENRQAVPSPQLVEKLEKVLGISLKEKGEN